MWFLDDMPRRVDAGRLAELVAEYRLDEDEAMEAMVDLLTGGATAVCKL